MAFGSKHKKSTPPTEASRPQPDGLRASGPWDASEREITPDYLDFSSILVRGVPGLELQVASDGQSHVAVLVGLHESAVELRAIAASKSGNDWDLLIDDVTAEIRDRGAEPVERQGVFGTEVLTQFPAKDPEGNDVVQPACFMGVVGPRWLLRATIIGPAALDGGPESALVAVVKDVIVRRGQEARLLGEPLPLTVPEQMQALET